MENTLLSTLQKEIYELEQELAEKKHQLKEMQAVSAFQTVDTKLTKKPLPKDLLFSAQTEINNSSPPNEKIALFRSLFRGREDMYAKRYESRTSGKSGYLPDCRNEWIKGVCGRPETNCTSCTKRLFEPVTDEVIRYHLEGFKPPKSEWGKPVPFIMGIYPLLQNETCHLLAIDFDKTTWQEYCPLLLLLARLFWLFG